MKTEKLYKSVEFWETVRDREHSFSVECYSRIFITVIEHKKLGENKYESDICSWRRQPAFPGS